MEVAGLGPRLGLRGQRPTAVCTSTLPTARCALVKAVPEGFDEVGTFTVPGSGERPSWSHPVIVGGKLYLREQDRILCYDIRAK